VKRVSPVQFVLALALIIGASGAQELRAAQGPGTRDGDPVRQGFHAGRVLSVPVVLDGVPFPAGSKLPDQALTFFVLKGESTQRVVQAFTSPVVAAEFRRQLREKNLAVRPDGSATAALLACTWTNTYSWFNKNVGCGGSDVLTMTYPNQYTDLDFNGWNNTISCVKAACNGLFTVIYSCRSFVMTVSANCADPDRWYISEGDIITDLNTVGMNNSTSSIRFE
jgi:hypothetical protein